MGTLDKFQLNSTRCQAGLYIKPLTEKVYSKGYSSAYRANDTCIGSDLLDAGMLRTSKRLPPILQGLSCHLESVRTDAFFKAPAYQACAASSTTEDPKKQQSLYVVNIEGSRHNAPVLLGLMATLSLRSTTGFFQASFHRLFLLTAHTCFL